VSLGGEGGKGGEDQDNGFLSRSIVSGEVTTVPEPATWMFAMAGIARIGRHSSFQVLENSRLIYLRTTGGVSSRASAFGVMRFVPCVRGAKMVVWGRVFADSAESNV
jgi:hypothetical protein